MRGNLSTPYTVSGPSARSRTRVCSKPSTAQGPRLVKTYAVWAGDEDRILFYDSNGQRFAQVRLSEAPDPVKLAG